jgi:hypothetical protein
VGLGLDWGEAGWQEGGGRADKAEEACRCVQVHKRQSIWVRLVYLGVIIWDMRHGEQGALHLQRLRLNRVLMHRACRAACIEKGARGGVPRKELSAHLERLCLNCVLHLLHVKLELETLNSG